MPQLITKPTLLGSGVLGDSTTPIYDDVSHTSSTYRSESTISNTSQDSAKTKTVDALTHEFQIPDAFASRAPCPALNTLANHGYLPRDGRNITVADLMKVLQLPETYNLSSELADFLAVGGLAMMRKTPLTTISLHDLARHGWIEHDASLVHKNAPSGHDYAPVTCDSQLLEEVLGGQEYLTLDSVAEKRVMAEKASNYSVDAIHRELARGEWALVLDIFGRERNLQVPADFLRVWLKENRFLEGWKPTHEQGLHDTLKVSQTLRKKMKEYSVRAETMAEDSEQRERERRLAVELTTPEEPKAGDSRKRDPFSPSPSPHPAKRQKTLS